jgi:hypothetical protein
VRAALAPPNPLLLGKALADDGIHRRFKKADEFFLKV